MLGYAIVVAAVALVGIPLVLNNVKLKAQNSKLMLENKNLEYELGKSLLNNKIQTTETIPSEVNKEKIASVVQAQSKPIKTTQKITNKKDVSPSR